VVIHAFRRGPACATSAGAAPFDADGLDFLLGEPLAAAPDPAAPAG
jgi:hypothetical protein